MKTALNVRSAEYHLMYITQTRGQGENIAALLLIYCFIISKGSGWKMGEEDPINTTQLKKVKITRSFLFNLSPAKKNVCLIIRPTQAGCTNVIRGGS